jgi:hypothetical protein
MTVEDGTGVSSVKISVNAKGARQWESKVYAAENTKEAVEAARDLAIDTDRFLEMTYGLPGG